MEKDITENSVKCFYVIVTYCSQMRKEWTTVKENCCFSFMHNHIFGTVYFKGKIPYKHSLQIKSKMDASILLGVWDREIINYSKDTACLDNKVHVDVKCNRWGQLYALEGYIS